MTLNPNPMPTTPCMEPSSQPNLGGACCLRMTLLCQTLQQSAFPVKNMADMYTYAHAHNNPQEPAGLWAIDPDAMAFTLNDQDPHDSLNKPSATYCYRTHIYGSQNQTAANTELQQSLDDYNMLVCTLRSGGYDWVAVSGYQTLNGQLIGFYVDDPTPASGQYNQWNNIAWWNSHWKPVVAQSLKWGGNYVIVRDDGAKKPRRTRITKAVTRPRSPRSSSGDLINPAQAGKLAIDGARRDHLDLVPEYANALNIGTPGTPTLVHDAINGASYCYLVPLVAPGGDPNGDLARTPVLGAIVIDARSGEVMTAFASAQPAPLFGVSADDTHKKLASEGFPFAGDQGNKVIVPASTILVNPTLIYVPTPESNVFQPYFQAMSGAFIAYVSASTGNVTGTLGPTGNLVLGG